MRGSVLVVDDQRLPRRALATELRDAGFDVCEAGDGQEGWEQFCSDTPDVVITDMIMPRSDGLDLLGRIRAQSEVPVILFTSRGSIEAATAAFKQGVDEFVCSPDVEIDDLVNLVAEAAARGRPCAGTTELHDRLVGDSRQMRRLREQLEGLAALRAPVLVSGEPGSGRDTAIRGVHDFGWSAGGPLVRVDADQFELPATGPAPAAVYLDGVEDFTVDALTHWTEKTRAAYADAFRTLPRVLASTSEPLRSLERNRTFRRTLGHLLLRFAIELPPLRKLSEDIPTIAAVLVRRIGASLGRDIALSPAASSFLAEQRWHGNVRQLEQVLERAITFSRGRQLRREVVADVFADFEESLDRIREDGMADERERLVRALHTTNGNISHTAEILEKSRSAVYRLIDKHGIPLKRAR